MFMSADVEKKLRAMRKVVESMGISEDLRGYAWEKPPVEPINDVRISVSDINGFCSTRRNVFVKYVLKEKPSVNQYMLKGLAYHNLIRDTLVSLKKAIYSGITSGEELVDEFFSNAEIPKKVCKKFDVNVKECLRLYRFLVLQISARVDEILSKYPDADEENIVGLALPHFVERKVDGSLVGLSKHLSVDVFTPHTVLDFKSGYSREEHMLALAGYALAIEADDETDVNYGFLFYIKVDKNVHIKDVGFVVSDELRRKFIEVRDEMAELVDSGIDPGKPSQCPKFCSYYGVCNEDCG